MTGRFDTQRGWLCALLDQLLGPALPSDTALASFQQLALEACTRALERYGGVILADEVGLGKSHVACAVMGGHRSVLVVPSSLERQWAELAPDVAIVTHAALSRGARIDSDCTLVVVDEAHRFANPKTRRYAALAEQLVDRAVLMLTATPVGIDVDTLGHLLRLAVSEPVLDELLDGCAAEYLTRLAAGEAGPRPLLRSVLVRRSRASVKRMHPRGITVWETTGVRHRLDFPVVTEKRIVIDHPAGPLARVMQGIEALDGVVLQHAEGLLRSHLLARLESSTWALDRSLARMEGWLVRRTAANCTGTELSRNAWRQLFGGAAEDEDRQGVFDFMFAGGPTALNSDGVAASLQSVIAIREALRLLSEPQTKSNLLNEVVDEHRTCLVFTRFSDTADAVFERLVSAYPNRVVGEIHGARSRLAGSGDVEAASLLATLRAAEQRSVLVCTDVLSEGMNLQYFDAVVNYDLAWNPRRLIQRRGRVDRLGAPGRCVSVTTLQPDAALDRELQLVDRLTKRAALHDRLLSGGNAREPWAGDLALAIVRNKVASFGDGTPLSGGWRMRATPRHGPMVLFWFDLGGAHGNLFCCDERGEPLLETVVAGRLHRLIAASATRLARAPAGPLRRALTAANRRRECLRARQLRPRMHRPTASTARVLRLADAALGGPADTAARTVIDRLVGFVSPATETLLARLLAVGADVPAVAAALTARAETPPQAFGALSLVAFVVFDDGEGASET